MLHKTVLTSYDREFYVSISNAHSSGLGGLRPLKMAVLGCWLEVCDAECAMHAPALSGFERILEATPLFQAVSGLSLEEILVPVHAGDLPDFGEAGVHDNASFSNEEDEDLEFARLN